MSVLAGTVRFFRKVVVVLVLVGLVGGAAWGVWHWRNGGGKAARYRTESVSRGRVASLTNASGTLVAEETIDVGAQVAGQIIAFGEDSSHSGKRVDFRSRVKKGDVLARIDDSLYARDVEIARAELEIARAELLVAKADEDKAKADLSAARARSQQGTRDLDRARRSGPGVSGLEYDSVVQAAQSSKAAVTAAEAGVERAKKGIERANKGILKAEASLKKAQKNLEYTIITSPVDGEILDRRVSIGQTVVSSLNAPSLFLIAKDLRRMQVLASVNEADIGRIYVGQATAFKVDAYPDEVFAGVVSQVRLNASMAQNVVTYTVVINVNNDNLRLLPYQTANVQFRADQRDNVLLVPNAALRYRPAPEKIDPEFAAEYGKGRSRGATVSELKPGRIKADSQGTVWVQGEEGLRPVKVRLGVTNGSVTEVLEVQSGDLADGAALVTGEEQAKQGGSNNPFAIKVWGGKKKE